MMRKSLFCLMFLSITMAYGAEPAAKPNAAAKKAATSRFARLAEQFMYESLALSPVSASQAGYHRHAGRDLDAELDDLSPESALAQEAFNLAWRKRFRKETPLTSLSVQDAADWRLIDDQIGAALLEYDAIQSYRHNPTGYVELIGNALFLPLTQEYAPKDVRVGHVLARIAQVPRAMEQAKRSLLDSDAIFIKVAIEENEGNVDLIESTVKEAIPPGSPLMAQYDEVAPPAIAALKEFSRWMQEDLAKRKTGRTWRLGKALYDQKFRFVMQTDVTPEQVLADAERQMREVRAEMLGIAEPMHKAMYPSHTAHAELAAQTRENLIIGEVLREISDDHADRDHLMDAVKADLDKITAFIRAKKIVSLSARENLKVIPTPAYMRGVYSVAGFHAAPPLEPTAEAEYWVTPIDPKMPAEKAESKLREYNNFVLQWLTIHEALPGHYIQFEHANSVQPQERRLLRALYGNGPYVEGWAEYIAQVMMDAGFANSDPRFRLSMRKIRLRVLANAILDIRLQTMNMSEADAMDLMRNQAFQTQAEAEGKLQRAKLSSTQLPTYFVGIQGWFALREKYEKAKGKAFNMQQFHDAALDQGPLPLPVLESILLAKKSAVGKEAK